VLQTSLHSVMTEAEYEAARAEVRATYGDSAAEAGARFEQELAKLFYRSGWTQEKLAEKEGKTQSYLGKMLRFGRFLNFSPAGLIPETALTEWRFRKFWDKTEGDERDRFKTVARLLAEDVPGRHKNVAPKIIDHFDDGKWHKVDAIAEKLDMPLADVEQAVSLMISKPKNYKAKCEQRHRGKEVRIFPADRMVSSTELIEKLAPIVKGLEEQGRKNMVTMSVTVVAVLAGQLRKLLDEWTE